ncbi:MAG: hypothetical protein ABIA47_00715 [bacterium]
MAEYVNKDAANVVIVHCGDPRGSHEDGDAILKRHIWKTLREMCLTVPAVPSDIRFDRVCGVSPVHMAAEAIRGNVMDFHLDWLWFNIINFMALHQGKEVDPEKVIFSVHTSCGAVGEVDFFHEREVIEEDLRLVSAWFRGQFEEEYPDSNFPVVMLMVIKMQFAAGDLRARPVSMIALDHYLEATKADAELFANRHDDNDKPNDAPARA